MELLTDIQNFIKANDMVVLGIITILVMILLYLWGRRKKGFSYYVESANAVVSVEEKVADQVKVFLGDHQVENVHLIAINIRNSGNQSIEEKDFTDAISFNFGEDALFLRASVVETDPPSLYPVFTHIHGTPVLMPFLLNGGDNFIVNFLVSNWDPDAFEVRGRIVGVKDIKCESEASGITKIILLLAGIFLVPAIILMYLKIITLTQTMYAVFFSYVLLFIAALTSRKNRKRYRAYIKNIRWF